MEDTEAHGKLVLSYLPVDVRIVLAYYSSYSTACMFTIPLRLSRFSESLRDRRSLYLFHFATVRNDDSAKQ